MEKLFFCKLRLLTLTSISVLLLSGYGFGQEQDKTPSVNEIRKQLVFAQNNKDDSMKSIVETTKSISKFGRAVVPNLIEIVQDRSESPYIRSHAVVILGAIKDLRAVEPLIERLHDNEWLVRDQAASTLANLTHNNFGKEESKWQEWWAQTKGRYLALVGDCINKSTSTIQGDYPCWIKEMIAREEIGKVANPPASLFKCVYSNQTVYYIPPRCCDIRSVLMDTNGTVICSPDGGFSGRGDGKCPNFFAEKKDCVTIWKDSRSSR